MIAHQLGETSRGGRLVIPLRFSIVEPVNLVEDNGDRKMHDRPLVSVIIPTYNRATVISETIDNVFSQTYKNIELIVVDDGSTDDTPAILRRYADRVRTITQKNAGPAAARNRGIEVSGGDIIAFQDSDDLWEPSKLERQVALLEKSGNSVPCCLCSASFGIVDGKPYTSFDISDIDSPYGEGLWLNVAEILATRFVLFNQTVAIRRWAIEKVGGFDASLKYLEDYDLPLRLAVEGPWAFIRDPLVIYREGTEHSFSKQAHRDPLALKDCEFTIFERLLEKVRNTGGNANLERHLERRLKGYRRGLRIIKLEQSNSPTAQTIAKVGGVFERYYGAAFRRSPWLYPRALTVPIDCNGSQRNLSSL
jgi:glycosyltransferase involved in cell wall biosynthesis